MNDTLKEILKTSIYFLIVLIFALLIVTFVGQRTVVDGTSMINTLNDKDNLIVDKITYRFKDPQRFDIVVFPYAMGKRTYYIKRVIGLPGETVFIDDNGVIYINDQVLVENYGRETIERAGRANEKITLGPDEYFVLGDNRIGRAWFRIYPFNKMGLVNKKK